MSLTRAIRALLALTLMSIFSCLPTAAAAIATAEGAPLVTSTELVEHPAQWDGRTVTFEGEAVGESMQRGSQAWIHLNDDAYARRSVEAGAKLSGFNSGMPIRTAASKAELIKRFGSYKFQGDFVRVTGVFRAASPDDRGEMLIEAQSLQVIHQGRVTNDPVEQWKLWAIVLMAVCLAALIRVLRIGVRMP